MILLKKGVMTSGKVRAEILWHSSHSFHIGSSCLQLNILLYTMLDCVYVLCIYCLCIIMLKIIRQYRKRMRSEKEGLENSDRTFKEFFCQEQESNTMISDMDLVFSLTKMEIISLHIYMLMKMIQSIFF